MKCLPGAETASAKALGKEIVQKIRAQNEPECQGNEHSKAGSEMMLEDIKKQGNLHVALVTSSHGECLVHTMREHFINLVAKASC